MLDYEIFFRFYNTFKAHNFQDINPKDSLCMEIEKKIMASEQFFHVANLIELKILFVCKQCKQLFGVEKEEMDPSVYHSCTHPDDQLRFGMARGKVMKMAGEMYQDKTEQMFISSNFKTKTASGEYKNILYQLALFYTEIPYKTVFSIQINTDVTELCTGTPGNHFYVGNDASFFRYPDKKLLMIGDIFSKREIDIIKGIARGLESHEIAKELFISVHTVNTHRRNILNKSGNRNTHELVHDLQERGVI